MKHLLPLILLILAGCASTTQQIARRVEAVKVSASTIQTEAEAGKLELGQALAAPDLGPEARSYVEPVVPRLDRIIEEAVGIHQDAVSVSVELPKVQDKPSDLLATLKLVAGAGLVLGLVGGAIYLGLGKLTRPALAGAGNALEGWAKLSREGKHDEATAALRVLPEADQAYRKVKGQP